MITCISISHNVNSSSLKYVCPQTLEVDNLGSLSGPEIITNGPLQGSFEAISEILCDFGLILTLEPLSKLFLFELLQSVIFLLVLQINFYEVNVNRNMKRIVEIKNLLIVDSVSRYSILFILFI